MDKIAIVAGVSSWPVDRVATAALGPADTTGLPRLAVAASAGETTTARLSAFALLWQQKEQAVDELQALVGQRRRLQEADRLVGELKAQISALVKNYPPFPIGSEERLAYLRSISALRQQLEALVVPPESQNVPRLPEPPQLPANGVSDQEWQGHVDALSAYRERLTHLHETITDVIARKPMWPEAGQARMLSDDQGSALLSRVVAGLRLSTATFGRPDDLAQAGLL